jgi:peptide/nickel transport system permease protein
MLFSIKPVFFVSDIFLLLFVIFAITAVYFLQRKPHWKMMAKQLAYQPAAVCSGIILCVYISIAIIDSIHFRILLPTTDTTQTYYNGTVNSVLDKLLSPIEVSSETTYSAPFAKTLYVYEWLPNAQGQYQAVYPPLTITQLQPKGHTIGHDIIKTFISWLILISLLYAVILFFCRKRWHSSYRQVQHALLFGKTKFPWRTLFGTLAVILLLICFILVFMQHYHIMGTDKIGNDVLYQSLKSIRTGVLIGGITTLFSLPFALVLGLLAGFFGGKTDDIIQYIYTTLSSIPGVLLIVAAVLSIQIYLANHPELFPTVSQRADLRLVALCIILGLTGWIGLCRVIRAETLKLREMDFVLAGRTLGTRWPSLLSRHILPNIIHIVIVSVVLDFSGLVLAEAVLTYVGAGVDPTTISWGNMIDGARLELAREPVVWWPLLSAFSLMFIFVLALNIFGDALNKAFNPREV